MVTTTDPRENDFTDDEIFQAIDFSTETHYIWGEEDELEPTDEELHEIEDMFEEFGYNE
jgi:hypothetical protein